MKNIILLILMILPSMIVKAQSVTASPAVFTAVDEVTLTVDVSGSSLEGYADRVWIWTWLPGGCPGEANPDCDAPTNINPAGGEDTEGALMTRDETNPNIYRITMTPVDFYGRTPAEIKELGIKLKSSDWSDGIDSGENLFIDVQPLVFIPSQNRNFPVKFTTADIVTLYFDQSLAENSAMKELEEIYAYIFVEGTKADGSAFSDVKKAEWGDVSTTPELQLTDRGNGIFSLSFIPEDFFPIEEGDQITKINYIFRSADGNTQTATFDAFPLLID
ncbi:hypothetical protein FNH22_10350 [Fulvivirga sp. M361]|uniref:DUF4961 domain-containing protein n=1 Tax=Fulvivirga sp. M361 TaxID=2594266 RepID=UPI00117B8E7A|nr:hypothetical protein [Fulvivirga sp. M361]TRX59543.1 hypothetical protein FNH22_10350 [Fulvivirga sp. M361]